MVCYDDQINTVVQVSVGQTFHQESQRVVYTF